MPMKWSCDQLKKKHVAIITNIISAISFFRDLRIMGKKVP